MSQAEIAAKNKQKIQAEIAAKKARLAELKEKRDKRNAAKRNKSSRTTETKEERKARLEERRQARAAARNGARSSGVKPRVNNVLDSVAGLIDTKQSGGTYNRDGPPPTLSVDTPTDSIINIESVVPETYDKSVECAIIGGTDDEKKNALLQQELEEQKLQLMEEEEKMKIFREQLKKDKLKYDKMREEERLYEPQELTGIEVRRIETSKDFQNFFQKASKIVERAINFSYDFSIDYLDGADAEDVKYEKIVHRTKLWDEKKTGSRAITSISWSVKFKELLLSSYAGQDDAMSLEPDGTVLIWNMHMPNRPEYTFCCNSAVLTAEFHPSNPKLIVGGCRSGQVVVWDTRSKKTPIDRTSLSRGHTYPVYALRCLPIVNNNNLISVSTDGVLCQWSDSNLHDPATELDLNATLKESEGKESVATDEITTTSFDFPGRETSSVILGSDEGKVYKARIYDQKGIWYTIDAHDAPITNVQFHPHQKNSASNVSDLFLTSSYDWTVKLWSNKTNRALYTFESARDYVFDAQWSTVHPAVFASGDGSGKLDIWNLTKDTDVPNYSIQVEKKGAISRLKWSEDGTNLAVGMSTGGVNIYDVKEELYNASNETCNAFYTKMNAATINV